MYYVYILRCRDGTLYAGLSRELKQRIVQHRAGQVVYTRGRLPVRLVYFAGFATMHLAVAFEQYLKTSSGIAFRNKRLVEKSVYPTVAPR